MIICKVLAAWCRREIRAHRAGSSRRLLPASRSSGVVAEGGPYPRQLSQEDLEASVHRSGSDRFGRVTTGLVADGLLEAGRTCAVPSAARRLGGP